jgi:hypothetical protein
MARQKEYKQINIDVEPFLSIMAIVLKLISLILVVIVLRIAVNPSAMKVVALTGLYTSRHTPEHPKSPTYIDCYPDKLVFYPGNTVVTWSDLRHPGNALDKLLDKIQANNATDYIVVMARPESVKLYRTVRDTLRKRPIDVGYDAVDADFKVNWDDARKRLGVVE